MNRRQRQAADRCAAFEAAVAAAQADPATTKSRPRPAAAPSPPDVARLVAAEVARQRTAEALAADQADYDRARAPDRQPCRRCGIETCWIPNDQGGAPGWFTDDGGGWRCAACDAEFWERAGSTEADRKMRVLLRLLDMEHSIPMRALGDPGAFAHIPVWFHEHAGARPAVVLEARFAHVDGDRLRQQWEQVLHPPPPADTRPRRRGRRCATCHTTTRIVETRSSPHSPPTDEAAGPWRMEDGVYTWEEEHCLECLRRWFTAAGSPPEAVAALG